MIRQWPLRWKVALYSALLGVAATIGGAVTTWFLLRYAEIKAFDQRLTMDAHEFFRDVENFEGGPANNRRVFKEIFVPLAMRERLVEVTDAEGKLLYRSPALHAAFPADGIKGFHDHKIEGRSIRLAEFAENGLTLRVGDDLKEIHRVGRDIFFAMLGAIPTVLLVILVGGRWVASLAIAPIEEVRQAAARITSQRLDQRLPVPPTGDEIAGLIEVLNAAFERLQRSFEQSARFSADASHHLKTPITVLRAGLEEILSDSDCSLNTQAAVEEMLHRVHELNSISNKLLLLARADAGRLELQSHPFDFSELLAGVLDDARALAEPLDLSVEAEVPKGLSLDADPAYVAIIAQSLVENAIKYNVRGGRVRILAESRNGSTKLSIGNTGPGITGDQVRHLFERFYRARGDERISGRGLGLSTARELARAHGGDVALERSDSEWTEVSLVLPNSLSAPDSESKLPVYNSSSNGS